VAKKVLFTMSCKNTQKLIQIAKKTTLKKQAKD
jgi:hypothetical protein